MHCTSSCVHVRVVAWCEFIYITCKAVYSLVKLMPSTDKWTLEHVIVLTVQRASKLTASLLRLVLAYGLGARLSLVHERK